MGKYICHILILYVIDFVKMVLILSGLIRIPWKKDKQSYLIVVLGLLTLLLLAGVSYERIGIGFEHVIAVFVIITVCLVYEGKISRKLVYATVVYMCILFFDLCFVGLISLIYHMNIYEIIQDKSLNLLVNSLNIITYGIIVWIKWLRKIDIGKTQNSKKIIMLLLAGVGTGIVFVGNLMITNLPGAGERLRKVLLVVTIVACITYFIVCIMLIIISESRDKYKILSQINQTIIESQQKYYTLAHEKQQEIRGMRHEMKNHLTCIYALLSMKQYEELKSYIKQWNDQIETLSELLDSGNYIVNAILNDAASRYKDQGIEIILKGKFPSDLYILPTDLCVIFANAIINAVEAIQRQKRALEEQSDIRVEIASFKDDLFIEISNPIEEKVEIHNGYLMTTKRDVSIHGFGTGNMRSCVEKYDGTINFESDEEVFRVNIHMKNVSKKLEKY